MMKRTVFIIGLLLCAAMISAQTPKDVKFRFTEANDLTMTGRLFSDNPNPYHRVDTERFKRVCREGESTGARNQRYGMYVHH